MKEETEIEKAKRILECKVKKDKLLKRSRKEGMNFLNF